MVQQLYTITTGSTAVEIVIHSDMYSDMHLDGTRIVLISTGHTTGTVKDADPFIAFGAFITRITVEWCELIEHEMPTATFAPSQSKRRLEFSLTLGKNAPLNLHE